MDETETLPPELESLFKTFDNAVSKDDFANAFEAVKELFKEFQDENADNLSLIQAAIKRLQSVIQRELDANEEFRALGKQLEEKVEQKLGQVDAKLSRIKNGEQGIKGEKGDQGERGERGQRGAPDSPQEIREKLMLAKIPLAAVEGIEELKEGFTQEIKKGRVQTPAKAFHIYTKDASSQCDGANKAFTVGGTHFGIVGVFGTQFPNIYRPVIDYTETKTGILLTSEVGAPESGQTLIIQFLK